MKMLGGVSLVGNGVRLAKREMRFEFADLGDLKQQMECCTDIMRGNTENFRRACVLVRTAQLLALLAVSDAYFDGFAQRHEGTEEHRDFEGIENHRAEPLTHTDSYPLCSSVPPCLCAKQKIDCTRLSIFGIGGVGCRIENANYWRDYAQNGHVMGRSSLFVSTLNSTPLCEMAITLGAQGSIRYVDNSSEVENFLDFYPEAHVLTMSIFSDRAAAGVFCRGFGNGLEDLLG